MKIPGVSLTEWLRRIGVRDPAAAPELGQTLAPVVLVADHTRLQSRFRLPEAHIQCYQEPATFAAPDHAKAEIRSGGPGGTKVDVVGSSESWAGASAYWCYSFASVPMAGMTVAVQDLTALGHVARNTLDPRFPVLSRVRKGAGPQDLFGAGAGDYDPIVLGGGQFVVGAPPAVNLISAPSVWQLSVWLPPGRFLYLEAYNPDTPIVWNIRIREYPAPEGSVT